MGHRICTHGLLVRRSDGYRRWGSYQRAACDAKNRNDTGIIRELALASPMAGGSEALVARGRSCNLRTWSRLEIAV